MRVLLRGAIAVLLMLGAAGAEQGGASTLDPRAERELKVRTPAEVHSARRALRAVVWGRPGPPRRPPNVARDVSDHPFGAFAPAQRIDRLTIPTRFGLRSIAWHLIPRRPNGEVVVYHQGHGGGPQLGREMTLALVGRGYEVLALAMPLVGGDAAERITWPNGRTQPIPSKTHAFLGTLPRPFRFFLAPVRVAIDYALSAGPKPVSMVGISGGGWTTVVYAALDPRVRSSYPVAGTLPMYLRRGVARDEGDWEQQAPALYRRVSYMDLYVLGATGRGRRQVQFFNEFDSCCFAGRRFRTYVPSVRRIVGRVGGGFDARLDRGQVEHVISASTRRQIMASLDTARRRASRS